MGRTGGDGHLEVNRCWTKVFTPSPTEKFKSQWNPSKVILPVPSGEKEERTRVLNHGDLKYPPWRWRLSRAPAADCRTAAVLWGLKRPVAHQLTDPAESPQTSENTLGGHTCRYLCDKRARVDGVDMDFSTGHLLYSCRVLSIIVRHLEHKLDA